MGYLMVGGEFKRKTVKISMGFRRMGFVVHVIGFRELQKRLQTFSEIMNAVCDCRLKE
jgi:hypothetical protein